MESEQMASTKATDKSPMRMSYFSVQDHYPARERTVEELYRQVIRQGELAEKLGYYGFFVAEHHFHEYGTVPNPAVMLAAIAQRTKNLKLGPAISVLTFHDPLTIAENYAMVDALSGGRMVLGVGSGYLKHEFEGYSVAPSEKRARFDENLAILKLALSGERFSYSGKYRSVNEVKLNVMPLQPSSIPIYVAVLAREAAYHVGRQGNNIMCVPYASLDHFDEIAPLMSEYKRGRSEGNSAPHDHDNIFAFHTHVAESDAACRERVADAFDLYVATRLYAKRHTYADIEGSGLGLFGSVDTVIDKIVRLHQMGITHLMTLQNFGYLKEAHVHESMTLMAEEVMPRVRQRLGQATAA
jgi:alkanesulfonate monooxygenase SsuD/methylene tetrahydromethanopterin reductase-like flavin-dependent oxidoreductase (luciferase family)